MVHLRLPGRAATGVVCAVLSCLLTVRGHAQDCGTPGKDGSPGTITGVVNTYYPGVGAAAAGATSISVGGRSGGPAITAGDLVLVIQVQDAQVNTANTDAYGDGVAGGSASGATSLGNSGRYEFVAATGPVAGGVLPIRGVGTGGGLLFSYATAAASGTQGQRRFQLVRTPQYVDATLGAGLTAQAWDGNVGAILALDVSQRLTLGGTVSLDGLGFRGGVGRQRTTGNAGLLTTDFRTLSTQNPNGSKAEGIAGSPSGLPGAPAGEGYPNGDYARGAPGNAGGGGTDGLPATNNSENSGGGGGGNGGAGGHGGNTWNSNLPSGGFGGASFPVAPAQLVLGGGGGAGSNNNNAGQSSAGNGGGIVLIRTGSVAGTGTIHADGTVIDTPLNDGGGGGGAGGSIVIVSLGGAMPGLTAQARGARGGNASTAGQAHGPGGGGGGGYVGLSGGAVTAVGGGAAGVTTTMNIPFNAQPGAGGVSRTNLRPADIPGISSGAECSLDTDMDGLTDVEERRLGTDPDDPDTDGDGLTDGDEVRTHRTNPLDLDTDDDGIGDGEEVVAGVDGVVTSPINADTDGDGVQDGTELGYTMGVPDPDGAGPIDATDSNVFIKDRDPSTTTNPLVGDTDGGGITDGREDVDHDGKLDPGETDPTAGHAADDVDTDMDGLPNTVEVALGTDPGVADTDGDGLSDGEEVGAGTDGFITDPLDKDTDDDGLSDGDEVLVRRTNPTDVDTDHDGLQDGTELGITTGTPDTDPRVFQPDRNPGTTTDPRNPDTDGGGVKDGNEDSNHDGALDAGETDPRTGRAADDVDTDMDGLPDTVETRIGTDPAVPDTDGDGILDGEETIPGVDGYVTDPLDADTDDDGLSDGDEVDTWRTDPTNLDTDGDGVQDGTEVGATTGTPDTDPSVFVPDGDSGTTTNPHDPDTDEGGASDGEEDKNANGAVDVGLGECDPRVTSDDKACLDSDMDGLTDDVEITIGTDPFNPDTDGDGIGDGVEVGPDGAYTPGVDTNPLDADTDDDGLLDGAETGPDGRYDAGVDTDPLAPDTDGDGIADGTEAGVPAIPCAADSDGDGTPDCVDPAPSDPLVTGTNAAVFVPDADGGATKTDPIDPDTDGDLATDGCEDANKNGRVDPGESDPRNPASTDPRCLGVPDSDGDGITDDVDLDDDNDGIPDLVEGPGDTDMDGVPDRLDLDTDNDGVPDTREAGAADADGDGRVDGFVDRDGDGLADSLDPDQGGTPLAFPDTDRDGVPDTRDLDSDNDGVTDVAEAGGADANGDGLIDGFADRNANGLADSVDPTVGGGPLPPRDTDGDGVEDRLDVDSDNDGIPDVMEAGGPDADGDGRIDGFTDADGDGLADAVDPTVGGVPLPSPDSDADGVPDTRDLDSDNDGIPDVLEAGGSDLDGDGVIDGFADVDRDGLADVVDPTSGGTRLGVPDTDGDGAPDYLDVDADGDGITDVTEADGADMDGNGRIDGLVDTNGNGLADSVEPGLGGTPLPDTDTNGDGEPDRVDLDTDGDGLPDLAEGFDPDVTPLGRDTDGDGLDDAFDPDQGGTKANLPDDDANGIPNWREVAPPNVLRNDVLSRLQDYRDGSAVFKNGMPSNPALDPFGANATRDAGEGANPEANGTGDDDDFYAFSIPNGWIDPDPTVATDPNRPLVFYELECPTCVLKVAKAAGSIRLTY